MDTLGKAPGKPIFYKIDGFKPFNVQHVIRFWMRPGGRTFEDSWSGKLPRVRKPSCEDFIWWKVFGGKKPKTRCGGYFIKHKLYIEFSNSDWPKDFDFLSKSKLELEYSRLKRFLEDL